MPVFAAIFSRIFLGEPIKILLVITMGVVAVGGRGLVLLQQVDAFDNERWLAGEVSLAECSRYLDCGCLGILLGRGSS